MSKLNVQDLTVTSFETGPDQSAAAVGVGGVGETVNQPLCYSPFCGPTYPEAVCQQTG